MRVSRENDYSRIAEQVTQFISEAVDRANADGAVIGLSGGIDSTTVAYSAVRALGKENVHGFVLPSSTNRESNMEDARDVADRLGITLTEIDIDPIVDAFTDAAPEPAEDKVAFGNMQVRTRAVILYMYANFENKIVLGTGNKSEALMGYFTKYGDQAVDINPIGDLYKTEVREYADYLGVPNRIITKPPSAGMWEGQEDESELGISYETADVVLHYWFDKEMETEDIVQSTDCTQYEVEIVQSEYYSSEHKRKMPPTPGIDFK